MIIRVFCWGLRGSLSDKHLSLWSGLERALIAIMTSRRRQEHGGRSLAPRMIPTFNIQGFVMAVVTLDLPEGLFSALRRSPEEFVRELRLAAAIRWYQRGEISQEKAAEVAGLNRRDFLLALVREETDVFSVNMDELREELRRG